MRFHFAHFTIKKTPTEQKIIVAMHLKRNVIDRNLEVGVWSFGGIGLFEL